ncbi:MAG: UTP--glucose-1-phosphate uridylyltransferase GalU [Lachnospiraceae bacterium]|jgi:UTP--glucose-1-phosphate uridylyltransferase|nr:UTP--glucose-1-phosphate uridylyltransferase GalU [Lachnospiraceae bacterium]MCI8873120.1 UTP--glucose-1-phosphate uridylyltransferase GalU [Lachnospiraceae bacterium]GFI31082.1 UTP--glucose-1-phosphate uridylyltransferase [Lachnospiraceae bacterium]
MKVKKAIIPAAGLGTRFLPATKAQPKEMLPIVDKPTIQYIIEEAVEAGIQDIIIVTGRNKRSIEDHFDRSIELELELERGAKLEMLDMVKEISEMANIHYIRQKEPRGLGHAILAARHFIGDEPFAVLLGDDVVVSKQPCLGQMLDVFREYQTSILGVQTVAREVVDKYGIIAGKQVDDRVYKVTDMVEKPSLEEAPSNVAVLGRYIITPEIFRFLETQDAGRGGEIQLTDALKRLAKEQAMYAYDFKGHRYDVGTKAGFIQANIEFALRTDELREEMKDYLKRLQENMEEMLQYD